MTCVQFMFKIPSLPITQWIILRNYIKEDLRKLSMISEVVLDKLFKHPQEKLPTDIILTV
ncbi:hypothetical protein BV210_00160 [Halorientalis sp. IM1011]|nr:hypothetical protein BV210_00160 [Halorientalis sp. IM1011]